MRLRVKFQESPKYIKKVCHPDITIEQTGGMEL